jgi:Flp pilus assembly protein TadG
VPAIRWTTGRRRPRDRGAAAVEFALILPVLLLIIFGIIDFGRMLNAQINASQAAREGARVVMLGGDADEAQERVDWAVGADGAATVAVTEDCPATPDSEDDARVTVTYGFQFVTPLGVLTGLVGGGGGELELTGRAVIPCRA